MGIIDKIVYILTGKSPEPKKRPEPWRPEARWTGWKPVIVCNYCTGQGDKKAHPNCRICAGTYF